MSFSQWKCLISYTGTFTHISVTLNQLEHAVGFERTMSAIAEALAAAANVSQLRIVDLQLKQMPKYTGNSGSNSILTALFSIGMPVDKRIKPANTSYLRVRFACEFNLN
jgi:hypothetical protein